MAHYDRYVNAASAGGDGTTSALSGANAAYTHLQDGETAMDGVCISGDTIIYHCAGSTADDTQCEIKGWVDDVVITLEGEYPGSEWDTSKYRLEPTSDDCLELRDTNPIRIKGMQLGVATGSAAGQDTFNSITQVDGTSDIQVSYCLIRGHGNDSYAHYVFRSADADSDIKMWNTVVYNASADASSYAVYGTCDMEMENCTFQGDGSYVVRRTGGTWACYNCYAEGGSTDTWFNGGGGDLPGSHCGTDDANDECPSTSQQTGTATFEAGADNWALASDDTVCIDNGTDRSSGLVTSSDDINQDARGATWDIGADEYIAAGAGENITKQASHYIRRRAS